MGRKEKERKKDSLLCHDWTAALRMEWRRRRRGTNGIFEMAERERQVGKWGEERFFWADAVRVLSEREVGMRWIVFALHFQSGERKFFLLLRK